MKKEIHILIIRLSAMGDVAMTVPVIRRLTAQHPEVKITVLSKAFLEPVFENIPNLSFFAADVNGTHKGLRGLYRLFRTLQKKNITHVADLHNVLRSTILRSFFSFGSYAMATIDKGRAEKKALTRSKNKIFRQLKTTHQRYADVFSKLGFPVDLSIAQPSNLHPIHPEVLKITKEKDRPWIGIAPFAQYPSKTYPLELMEEVIKSLSNDYRIFLFGGGKKEASILSGIQKKYNNTYNMVGTLSLNLELNLIAQLDLMIAMDSGNAHFAAMQQVPTITLWGATHPYAGFAPFGQPKDHCLLSDRNTYPNLPTSIYGNKVLEGYKEAMRTIHPDQILGKARDILSS